MMTMARTPKIGAFLDTDEEDFITLFEASDAGVVSGLTDQRRKEIEALARSTIEEQGKTLPPDADP
ncbi:hypothetical protein [Rhizobium sp. OAE497]|uniref:hypothetical protein n=1 Tax=Rhizobium sp. OAE497 TaxID=2663796 RepID=UPI000DD778AE